MTPALRDMPTIKATWSPDLSAYLIPFPDGTTRTARTVEEVDELVPAGLGIFALYRGNAFDGRGAEGDARWTVR
jgi:hypothetical protein